MEKRSLDVGRLAVGRVVLHFEMRGAEPVPMLCTGARDGNRVTLKPLGAAGAKPLVGVRHLDDADDAPETYLLGFWSLGVLDRLLVDFAFPDDGEHWSGMPNRSELNRLLTAGRAN